MKKTIDAREDYRLIDEYKSLIVNDNCRYPGGFEVLVDQEKTARKLSLYTAILGYQNRIESIGDDWALIVDIGECLCPIGC